MRRYLNLDTREWQVRPDFAVAIDSLPLKRGDNDSLDLVFVRAGVAVEIDAYPLTLTSFIFSGKAAGDLRSDHVISNWDGAAYTVTKSFGMVFADGVLTTSTALTSATAAFTTADLGRIVTGTGIPTDTSIAAIVSATAVTLSAAATATATGVVITVVGRTPTYTVSTGCNSVELGDLLVDGTVGELVATTAARYALTGKALGYIVRQTDNQTYWKVINIAQLANSAGWSQDVPQDASVTLDGEVETVVSGKRTSTKVTPFAVENDVIFGAEGVPISANPSYPPPAQLILWRSDLTAFTGGTTALDGVDIALFAVGTVISMVATAEGVASQWLLSAPVTITAASIEVGVLSTITAAAHGLVAGTTAIVIGGSNSTPTINGARTATYVGATTFTVPVDITVAGTAGYFGPAENAPAGFVQPDTAVSGRYWKRIL